jgi:hypothetical protein
MKTRIATFMHVQMVHPMSTIGFMVLKNRHGTFSLPCDLRLTCEALNAAFGGRDVRGKARLRFKFDDAGVLQSFEPVGDA